jgi:UDP-2,3-diacylglucosamine pyrophosphatase LpxH
LRTAIVSDLHLGSAFGEDLLRDAAIRRALLEEIDGADRLVLLGDALELRELPLHLALEAARPFFEELGEAMSDGEVVIVPGNHDHRVAEPLLERLAMEGTALGLEHRSAAEGEPAGRLEEWLGGARLEIAYPGIWLRDDVYAIHGHYMDCHMSLPRLECLAAAAVMRAFGPLPAPASAEDYERVLRPIYGLAFGLAQSGLARRATRPTEKTWKAISRRRRQPNPVRRALLTATVGAGIPAVVWTANRALRAEFEPDLSAAAISRSGVRAATELADRMRLEAEHVITGHTHRAGPRPEDGEWRLAGGGRLHNSGSWVFATAFHHPGTPPGPYWPGTVTWLEDDGPPRRSRLLDGHPQESLRETVRGLRRVTTRR